MLSALLFDLDGTLIDSNEQHAQAWADTFEAHGYRIELDRIRPEIGKGGDQLVPSILGPTAEGRDGEALRTHEAERYAAIVAGTPLRVFDGAVALLAELRRRGIRTALATSSGEEQLDATFRSAGVDLRTHVDVVVSKADVEQSKPEPDVIVAALRKLGCTPAECAMVGDTTFDAIAATRAGVVTLGVLSGRLADERQLIAAGARRVWADAAAMLADLDEVVRVASPTAARLDAALLDRLMREALAAAEEGMAAGEAPIGCAIADGAGRILGRGYNTMNASQNKTAHAEIVTFGQIAGTVPLDARDLILASTLEPCVMCTGAAMEAAVDTIVYALIAPADSGTRRVRPPESPESQMPRIVGGVLADESRALFERWMAQHAGEPQAAYVEELLARTADGETPASTPAESRRSAA